MKIVDLSVVINKYTPVYPGDPVVKIQPSAVLDEAGYQDHVITIGTHVGTHVDAPIHMIKGGKNLGQFKLDKFVGNGVCIKTDGKFDLNLVKKVEIKEDDIVLFNTGMSSLYPKKEYFEKYPGITEEIANYLVSKKVKMVGVDMCSVDHEPFKIHKILLRNDVLIIENLTNLSQLVGKKFKVYAIPINLQIDGAPARVFAEVS